MNHKAFFDKLVETYDVDVRYKDESWFMKVLGVLTFFNKVFMSRMTTTLMNITWFPNRRRVEDQTRRAWRTLCHEIVHIVDWRQNKIGFMLGYAMPQLLALGALLGLVFQSWWFLLFLVFLAPIPSPWRKNAEMRGYAMSMAIDKWYYGIKLTDEYKDDLSEHFTGPNYWFMWWWPGSARKEIDVWAERIETGEIFGQGEVFLQIHDLIQEYRNAR